MTLGRDADTGVIGIGAKIGLAFPSAEALILRATAGP
jgi:hypothetical protein